jgi:hypothetical protein
MSTDSRGRVRAVYVDEKRTKRYEKKYTLLYGGMVVCDGIVMQAIDEHFATALLFAQVA